MRCSACSYRCRLTTRRGAVVQRTSATRLGLGRIHHLPPLLLHLLPLQPLSRRTHHRVAGRLHCGRTTCRRRDYSPAIGRHMRLNPSRFAPRRLLPVALARIGHYVQPRGPAQHLLRRLGHGQQTARIICLCRHLLRHDDPVRSVHRRLHVVRRTLALRRAHETRRGREPAVKWETI
jgi:hypothetical protein